MATLSHGSKITGEIRAEKLHPLKKKVSEDTEATSLGVIPRDKRKIHNKEDKFLPPSR